QEVVRALLRHGAHVELLAARFGGQAPPGLESVPQHALPAAAKGEPAWREREALAANEQLAQALASAGPFDLVYERYSLWSYAAMEYARWRCVPGLLEVNAPLVEEQARYRALIDREG